MTEHTKTVVNIVAIGNSNIGKTSLLIREASNIYADIPAVMIGIDFKTKQYQVGGMNVKSHLWDICTGGEGEIRHRKTPLYRGVHAAAICFSLNNYDSFDDLSKWIQEVRSHNSIAKVFLVGCKGDIESVVSDEKALKFAQGQGLRYFKTSSKQNWGVNELFQVMIKEGLEVKLAQQNTAINPVQSKLKCEIM